MIHTLVPITDTSDHRQGLEIVRSLAAAIPVAVDLIMVVDDASGSAGIARIAEAMSYLDAHATGFPEGTSVRTHVRSGDPVTEIMNVAADLSDGILVLSPRWSAETSSFMPDSVSERLIQRSQSPILLATTDRWPRALSMDNIMIPVSLNSPDVDEIVEITDRFAQFRTVFRLVFVITGKEARPGQSDSAPESRNGSCEEATGFHARWRLIELGTELRRHEARSTWELRYGDPVQEFSRAAATTGANLIVFPRYTYHQVPDRQRNEMILQISHNAATPALLMPSEQQSRSPAGGDWFKLATL